MRKRPLTERLWEKIKKCNPDECWEWTAGITNKGYGAIAVDGEPKLSHRVVFEEVHGFINESLCIMHTCDNRKCCNPAHLIQGTLAENNNDRHRKGRTIPPPGLKGSTNPRNKLNEQQVIEIFFASGTLQSIADAYGVKMQTVHDIKKGRNWGWLTEEATRRAGQSFR